MNALDLSRAEWRKSSRSSGGPNCVEVAWPDEAAMAVRDSKNPGGPTLAFPVSAWAEFVRR